MCANRYSLKLSTFFAKTVLAIDSLFQMLEREAIRLSFDLSAHWPRIRTLMSRYRQMELADASVVVMTELQAQSQVLTIDRRDFSVYRRNDRQVIDFVSPGLDKAS